MRQGHGFALGPVLAIGMVCLLLAFSLGSLATFQLGAASQSSNSDEALYLAEGAVAQTMACLWNGMQASPPSAFGLSGQSIIFEDRAFPGAQGQVSFDPATLWGYSTNNFDGRHATGWNHETLPSGAVQIVARGTVGHSSRTVEAIVTIPPYPYVLSVDGALDTQGTRLIAVAESSMSSFAADATNGNLQSIPANIGSNTTVSLGNQSQVSGNIVCKDASSISCGPGTVVGGALLTGVVTPPRTLKVASYNNQGEAGVQTLGAEAAADVVLTSDAFCPTGLTVAGHLKVQGCTLFVNGDLSCTSVEGTGAVFVMGNVTMNGGATVNASNDVALAAAGNVTLTGAAGKYFQGLVFTEGTLTASNLTIAGCFVSIQNGADGLSGASGMKLQNVTAVYVSDCTQKSGQDINRAVSAGSIDPDPNHRSPITLQPATPAPPIQTWAPAALIADNAVDTQLLEFVKSAMANDPVYTRYLEAGGLGCHLQPGPGANPMLSTQWTYTALPAGSAPLAEVTIPLTSGGVTMWAHLSGSQIYYDNTTNQFIPLDDGSGGSANAFFSDGRTPIACVGNGPGFPCCCGGPPVQSGFAAFDRALSQFGYSGTAAELIASLVKAQMAFMQRANQLLKDGLVAGIPDLSLNHFISNSSPLHIVSWRER